MTGHSCPDPGSRRFGADARLGSKDLERVFLKGRKIARGDLVLWWLARDTAAESPRGARLGLSVSRKLGSAVRRNRLKRLLRESFRLNRSRLRPEADIALYPRQGCRWEGLAQAETALLDLCRRAGLLAPEP